MGFTYGFITVLATIFAVYSILRLFGVFDISSSSGRAKTQIEDNKKAEKKRKREITKLGIYATITNMFKGILMNPFVYEQHKFYIERLQIKSEPLNRLYTPEELRGKYATPFAFSVVLIPLTIWFPIIAALPIAALIYLIGYQTTFKMKIQDEDEIIDNYFIDLYLLMYSKLKQGSRARLRGTIENYIETLESQAQTDITEAMLGLARYFLNLLALYEDHVAVPKLKDVYRSATVINFCNVATQSLNGISNEDNLLSFKLQLVERKENIMRKRAAKIFKSAERRIYLIWVILFIFVICGWISKLPTGMF